MTTTKCPECLSLWTAHLDVILSNERVCVACRPRVEPNPDKDLLDWIQRSPNPRLHQVVRAWTQNKGGLSLRSAIAHCALNSRPD